MNEPYKRRIRLAAMLVGIAILVVGAAITIFSTAAEKLPPGEENPLSGETDTSMPLPFENSDVIDTNQTPQTPQNPQNGSTISENP